MEEGTGTWVLAVIVGLIVLVMIALFSGPGDIQHARANMTAPLAIDYVPGAGKFTSTVKDMDTDTVEIKSVSPLVDGYLYEILLGPKLRIQGEGEADVIALVTFKSETAKAKTIADADTFHVIGGEDAAPELKVFITSEIPPIREYTGGEMPDKHPLILKNPQSGAPILMTAYLTNDRELQSSLISPYPKICKVTVEFTCGGAPKYTEAMRGCDTKDPLDCEENIELCDGNVNIKLLDKPDCSAWRALVDVSYDGTKEFNVAEIVGLSFWKDTQCTRSYNDYFALTDFCCPQKDSCDRIGGEYKLKAALVP